MHICHPFQLWGGGQLLKEKNLLLEKQILSLKSRPFLRKEAIRNLQKCQNGGRGILFNGGQLLKEKNLLLEKQILSLKSRPFLRKEAIRNLQKCQNGGTGRFIP